MQVARINEMILSSKYSSLPTVSEIEQLENLYDNIHNIEHAIRIEEDTYTDVESEINNYDPDTDSESDEEDDDKENNYCLNPEPEPEPESESESKTMIIEPNRASISYSSLCFATPELKRNGSMSSVYYSNKSRSIKGQTIFLKTNTGEIINTILKNRARFTGVYTMIHYEKYIRTRVIT
jgi:hypothetical protein